MFKLIHALAQLAYLIIWIYVSGCLLIFFTILISTIGVVLPAFDVSNFEVVQALILTSIYGLVFVAIMYLMRPTTEKEKREKCAIPKADVIDAVKRLGAIK